MRLTVAALCVLLAACRADTEPPPAEVPADVPTAEPEAQQPQDMQSMGMIDPETASRDVLAGAPGMDAAVADTIIANRPYADMRALDAVLARSLSAEQRQNIYTYVWKPLDLNTASPDEIMLIPGMTPRMRHEFEEYRPYTDMAQFRREMAKYVDDAEVERLARYVTIR